jgi:5-methyltetrahydrofolate--homocysteine methyltransferase
MLARMVAEQDTNRGQARAVFGLFPANAVGDDIEIYADESRQQVLMSWHGLRQQHERPAGKPNYCLADFVAGKDSGVADYVGAFAVTAGLGIEGRLAAYERTMTTTTRSCSRRWPTAWPKLPPNGCTPRCARSSGATCRPRR